MAVFTDVLLSYAQIALAIPPIVAGSYLAAAAGFPLIDAHLVWLDKVLFGFDWDVATAWVLMHPAWDSVLRFAYGSVWLQALTICAVGSMRRPGDRNGNLIWSFLIGGIITCAVFVFTPALGKVGAIGPGQIEALTQIRGGSWTSFDFSQAQGVVSFPSFHTTLAVLFAFAARRPWPLLLFAIPLNVLMVMATPSVGGHYLIDLPAGLVVAVAAIGLAQAMRQRLKPDVGRQRERRNRSSDSDWRTLR